jgi:hypothetical protein
VKAGGKQRLFFDPEDGSDIFLRNGVTSQKTVLFITTAVKTSDPTCLFI